MSHSIHAYVRVPDHRDRSGLWVRVVNLNKTRFTTSAGAAYGGICNRIRDSSRQRPHWPHYSGCTSSFKDFQDFAEWYVIQNGAGHADWQVDKDILVKGNRVYSKSTCVLVPFEINMLLVKCDRSRGDFPIGVYWNKARKLFVAQASGNASTKYLGGYSTAEAAFSAYKYSKESAIQAAALKYQSALDPRAVKALLNYQVEITD